VFSTFHRRKLSHLKSVDWIFILIHILLQFSNWQGNFHLRLWKVNCNASSSFATNSQPRFDRRSLYFHSHTRVMKYEYWCAPQEHYFSRLLPTWVNLKHLFTSVVAIIIINAASGTKIPCIGINNILHCAAPFPQISQFQRNRAARARARSQRAKNNFTCFIFSQMFMQTLALS
jgi:hypothetical protein